MKHSYLIGEIGQNHNGSVEIAKKIIDTAAQEIHEKRFGLRLKGMDAVKLTKRDLEEELSRSAMQKEYNSPNSFGKTYGEHREFLELSSEEHFELYQYAKSHGLDFVETLCAINCLSLLKLFRPDRLKVASRDLTNLPLLEAMAETEIPIILSTGMAGKRELDEALEVVGKKHTNISILHCVSEYPTHPDHVNLLSINYLKKHYPEFKIGFSDHTIGISAPIAAVAMGAEIIEKHITLDREMKGTDQASSLGPDGIRRMVRDIRLLDRAMGVEDIFISEGVKSSQLKLERSIATKRKLVKGHIIQESDLHLLSPGDGIKWRDRSKLIGKELKRDVSRDEIIYPDFI